MAAYVLDRVIGGSNGRTERLMSLRWRYNGGDGVSSHQPHHCLLNSLFTENINFRVTGLCVGKSPMTGEFPAQMASNAENVSIWWRHHDNLSRNGVEWIRKPHLFNIDKGHWNYDAEWLDWKIKRRSKDKNLILKVNSILASVQDRRDV